MEIYGRAACGSCLGPESAGGSPGVRVIAGSGAEDAAVRGAARLPGFASENGQYRVLVQIMSDNRDPGSNNCKCHTHMLLPRLITTGMYSCYAADIKTGWAG